MRKYIIIIALLLVGGIAASFFLIPSEKEIVVMKEKDDAIRTTGYVDYQAEYDAGRRNENIIVGLANLYIGEGRPMQALPILEKHVQEYPEHIEARKKLAELYQAAGRDEDYLREIEYIAQKQPTESNLKLLADMYNYVGMYNKQAETLRTLIQASNGNNPEYYVDLATILMLEEDKAGAADTLQQLRSKHPEYLSFKLVRLMVSNFVDVGQPDRGYQEAQNWTNRNANAAEIADLANIINYGGRPDLALKLIEQHQHLVTTDYDLLTAYVNASIIADKRDQAFAVLREVHKTGKLPAPLYRPYIELALERGELSIAESIVDNLDNQYFTEDDAINLVELAIANESPLITKKLIATFDQPDYIDDKKALDAIIALIRRDIDEDDKIEVALQTELTRIQRLRLAQACARNDKTACFNNLVARFPEFADMTPRELDEVAMLYISVDRQRDIYEKVEKVAEDSESEIIKLAYIKLAASLGDREVVQAWLNREGRNTSTGRLSELFFIANDRHHGDVAMDLAVVLYDRDPNDKHREYLISGYMRAGQYAKALPLLREVSDQSREDEDNYLAALTKLGKSSQDHRDELREYLVPQLDSDSVSSERKRQFVFMLINSGNKKSAVPYINKFAKSEGGEWRKMYNQIHSVGGGKKGSGGTAVASAPAKPAITDMPRDYRMAMALDPLTSEKTRKMLAFSLLDDGYKADATYIFQELARNKSPHSQEVKDLLYLWGPRLNEEQLQWLAHRARTAQLSGERVKWGEYISTYGDDYALMNFVTSNPDALSHPSIREKYFSALATNADAKSFDQGMVNWVNATNDPAALKDYIKVAKAYGYKDAAVRALKKVEMMMPGDEETIKDLGILTYTQADYSESEKYLDTYIVKHQASRAPQTNPFEALYYKGELLRREGNPREASRYFNEVLRMGPMIANTLQLQSMYYSAQFHLGYHREAKEGFYGLLARYPNDKSLLADFMSALIEYKYHDEAMALANQYDDRSPYYGQMSIQPMEVMSPYVQNIESYEHGRELRINFNRPVPQHYRFGDSDEYGWLEKTEVGYDSVLIAAKPGYNLRFTPTSDESLQVIPAGQLMTAEDEMKRQQELRLQLLYARLELETGQEEAALARLHTLEPHYPTDSQLLGYTANAENYTGNWPRALTLLENAQDISPANEDIAKLKRDIERVHAQYIKLDHDYRRIGDSDEHITSVSGAVRVTNNMELGATFQNDELTASQIRRASDGRLGDYDHSKQRGEVYAAYYFGNGDRLQGSVFANNDTAGAGVYYSFNNQLGRTEALAEYHRPYWDFVEAVAEDATRDRVGLKHVGNITDTTTMSGEASINRYNIEDDDDVASTVLVRANVVQQIQAENPYLGVGYGFDGEYVIDKNYRPLGATGDQYSPFPMTSREIHFLSGIVAQDITDSTRAELVAGYAVDRLGDHGPQVEGKITQDLGEDVEAQVRARYGLETRDTEQNATTVGGHLKYKF